MEWKFTTIQHDARKKLDLSLNEYAVIDMIHNLCSSPESQFPQWCYASKEELAKAIGLTKTTILVIIDKAIKKGLIIKHPDTKFIKTTQKWYDEVYLLQALVRKKTDGKDSLPMVRKKTDNQLPVRKKTDGKETLPNNNISNNIYNNIEADIKSMEYLQNIPIDDLNAFKEKYQLKEEKIKWEADKAYSWLKTNGRKKSDYKHYLHNWLRRVRETLNEQNAPEQSIAEQMGYITYEEGKKKGLVW